MFFEGIVERAGSGVFYAAIKNPPLQSASHESLPTPVSFPRLLNLNDFDYNSSKNKMQLFLKFSAKYLPPSLEAALFSMGVV